jgi:uncharacterized membrane protein YgcG
MLGFLFGLMVSLWLGVSLALAQSGYPQPTATAINDFAHLLNSNDAAAITQLLTDLKNKHGIEGVVVVLNSIHDYPTGDETIETFATHLFSAYGASQWQPNCVPCGSKPIPTSSVILPPLPWGTSGPDRPSTSRPAA